MKGLLYKFLTSVTAAARHINRYRGLVTHPMRSLIANFPLAAPGNCKRQGLAGLHDITFSSISIIYIKEGLGK